MNFVGNLAFSVTVKYFCKNWQSYGHA